TLSSVTRAGQDRNSQPAVAPASVHAAIVIAACAAVAPSGCRSAYGGRENPMTVSQPITPSGTPAVASDSPDLTVPTTAHTISTPVAGSRPFSAAATVPTANSAANPAGSAYGADSPRRRGQRRAARRCQRNGSSRLPPVILIVISAPVWPEIGRAHV